MNLRDSRERVLRAKLKRMADELGLDADTLIACAQKYQLFRDIREAGNEVTINIQAADIDAEAIARIAREQIARFL